MPQGQSADVQQTLLKLQQEKLQLSRAFAARLPPCIRAYVSIRQHTSAYVSIRQHTSAYVSIRQHMSGIAYFSFKSVCCTSAAEHTRAAPVAEASFVIVVSALTEVLFSQCSDFCCVCCSSVAKPTRKEEQVQAAYTSRLRPHTLAA
jgi:hypothetical protein